MAGAGYKRAVCFTCGNATAFLRSAGVEVVSVGEKEELKPNKWFSHAEIHRYWPDAFNATSGDLPVSLMFEISKRLRRELGEKYVLGEVETGSGETILCLMLAYPEQAKNAVAVRNTSPATAFNKHANLNCLLEIL